MRENAYENTCPTIHYEPLTVLSSGLKIFQNQNGILRIIFLNLQRGFQLVAVVHKGCNF